MQGNKEHFTRNSEGYLDMTAFRAISNLYKGEYKKMATWNDGDIIKLRLPDRREVFRIVLKAHDAYATTLALYDNECRENGYPVKIDAKSGKKHADLGKIAFTKNWDLDEAQFVRAMDEEEFGKLLRKIGDTLGIPAIASTDDEVQRWADQYKELQAFADSLTADNHTLLDEKAALSDKVGELEAEVERLSSNRDIIAMEAELESVKAKLAETMEKLSFEVERGAASRAGVIKAEAERDVYKSLYMSVMAVPAITKSPLPAWGTEVTC